jgi:hypothetical protein
MRQWYERALAAKQGAVVYYAEPDRAAVLQLVRQVKKETKMLLLEPEAYQLFVLVRGLQKVKGAIAEVGTYRGGSAKLICEADPYKAVHLFDTFEGLPEVDAAVDAERFHTGQYATSLDAVRAYLAPYPQARLYQGFFPDTAGPVQDEQFSFVHLDVDIYKSTFDSLGFFYPRIVSGGMLLSHDNSTAQGVKKAFEDFFADKPESVIELAAGSQCLVVKA